MSYSIIPNTNQTFYSWYKGCDKKMTTCTWSICFRLLWNYEMKINTKTVRMSSYYIPSLHSQRGSSVTRGSPSPSLTVIRYCIPLLLEIIWFTTCRLQIANLELEHTRYTRRLFGWKKMVFITFRNRRIRIRVTPGIQYGRSISIFAKPMSNQSLT